MKTKFATFFDNISISTILAFLMFCWINFVSKNKIYALTATLLCFCLCVIVLFWISKNRFKKQNISNTFLKNVDEIYANLQFVPTKTQTQILKQKLNEVETTTDNFVATQDCIYFNSLLSKNLDINLLSNIIRQTKDFLETKTLVILCESFLKESKEFAQSLNIKIEIWNKFDVVKKLCFVPQDVQTNIQIIKPKKTLKTMIEYALSPKRFRSYFVLGLVLIVSSFFVFFKIYYLATGTFLLCLSLFVFIKKIKARHL